MPTFIYALKEPKTRKIRYIGVTSRPEARFRQHLKDARCPNHRTNWIRSLLDGGQFPEMELLVEVPESEREKWEIKFIATAREMGLDLVNGTTGGGGCSNPTREAREKMGAATRGKIPSVKKRAALSMALAGIPKSKAHCKAIREAWTPERRRLVGARMSAINKGKLLSDEHRAKLSLSRQGVKRGPYKKKI